MIFPSRDWLAAAVASVNAQAGLAVALRGLGDDLAAVVEADPPAFTTPFAAYGRHGGGRITSWRVLPDPDEIFELEPAYVVRAPYRLWKALLRGEDPIKAALSGRLRVEGDLQELVRRANQRHVIEAALAAVATEFSDEGAAG